MKCKQSVHAFVATYIATDAPIRELLTNPRYLNDPVVATLGRIHEALADSTKAIGTLHAASRLSLDEVDPNLAILLIYYWSYLALQQNHEMEALALHRRARMLISRESPPEIRGLVAVMESDIAQHCGDIKSAESILRNVCATVPKNAPRYKGFLYWLCALLCIQGRGTDVKQQLAWLQDHCMDNIWRGRAEMACAMDDVATGKIDSAILRLKAYEMNPAIIRLDPESYRYWAELARLYREEWAYEPLRAPDAVAEDAGPAAWVWSTYALLRREPTLALHWARRQFRNNLASLNSIFFEAHALVRAELALGNAAAARHLLELRQKRKIENYFDDFFWMRVEWQTGNLKEAARRFSKLLRSVEHYRAEGRLEFEFRLACDLSAGAAVQLGRMVEQLKLAKPEVAPPRSANRAIAKSEPPRTLLIGASTALQAIRDSVERFASLPVPVLITGETGTGKELVARALHDNGIRKNQPFIAVNCGAIAESLLESELFGHTRGAFTGAERDRTGMFEEASDGTLFLDEIGEISPRLQVALLRVLESGEIRPAGSSKAKKISCRLLFATNAHLDDAVSHGNFRRDLLYRLRRLEIHIPGLRERREDILPLAQHFFKVERDGTGEVHLSEAARSCLQQYAWPGNVRELRNEIERMRLFNSDKDHYELSDLSEVLRAPSLPSESAELFTPERREGAVQTALYPLSDAALAPHSAKQNENLDSPDAVAAFLKQGRLTYRRLGRLRDLFVRHKRLTRTEVARILNTSLHTATRDLKTLRQEGFILKMEPTAAPVTHYFIINESREVPLEA